MQNPQELSSEPQVQVLRKAAQLRGIDSHFKRAQRAEQIMFANAALMMSLHPSHLCFSLLHTEDAMCAFDSLLHLLLSESKTLPVKSSSLVQFDFKFKDGALKEKMACIVFEEPNVRGNNRWERISSSSMCPTVTFGASGPVLSVRLRRLCACVFASWHVCICAFCQCRTGMCRDVQGSRAQSSQSMK